MAMYLGSNKVEIGANGGGGSSDFSTATVTVVTNDSFYLNDSVLVADMIDKLITGVPLESGDYPLLLYKGEFETRIIEPDGMNVTTATGSGGVSISTNLFGQYIVTITGDGTLNVTVE